MEDPLTFVNGEKVQTQADWRRRRQEILDIFAREMYGVEPPPPPAVVLEKVDEKTDALGGFATRTQFKMYFNEDKTGPCLNWMLLSPTHVKGPTPVIVFLNYRGAYEMLPDTDIPLMTAWVPKGPRTNQTNQAQESSRGIMCDPNQSMVLPTGMILAKGYSILTACYAEVSPDPSRLDTTPDYPGGFAYSGVFSLWGERDESRTDNPTALGAWAWALSRGMDMIEQLDTLDAKRVVVTGCSRLGKAAFLAAARDERFAVCVPNQCGGGGVTLAKRDFGENVATQMVAFPHWYCKAYKKYETNPAELLTFDQHLLVATIAPRPLLIQGFDQPWFDTEGEFLACKAAGCVWEFLGKENLPQVDFPAPFDCSAIGRDLGYYYRLHGHGIAAWDWMQLLDFASAHLL